MNDFDEIPELYLEMSDSEWDLTYTDHDRQIARAIVFDDHGYYYFVRVVRDDDFGKATLIETSGGGMETGEKPEAAIKRALTEERGRLIANRELPVLRQAKRITGIS